MPWDEYFDVVGYNERSRVALAHLKIAGAIKA